jgi:hypothetical protein
MMTFDDAVKTISERIDRVKHATGRTLEPATMAGLRRRPPHKQLEING